MEEKQAPTATLTLAMILIVAGPIGAYVGGYFWFCEWVVPPPPASVVGATPTSMRTYARQWQADLFASAAQVETWIRGEKIVTGVARINL